MMLDVIFLVRREFCTVVPEASQHENRSVLVFILCNLVNLPLTAISLKNIWLELHILVYLVSIPTYVE